MLHYRLGATGSLEIVAEQIACYSLQEAQDKLSSAEMQLVNFEQEVIALKARIADAQIIVAKCIELKSI